MVKKALLSVLEVSSFFLSILEDLGVEVLGVLPWEHFIIFDLISYHFRSLLDMCAKTGEC